MSLAQLADLLSPLVERTVVDRTGLAGSFDVELEFAPESERLSADGNASPGGLGPSIFTALQEQLGLKLESARGAVTILVIDSAERPTPD